MLGQLRPTIWSTTGGAYCSDLESSHRPKRKIADMLALTRLRSAHLAAYVWQRPYPNYPNAPMGDPRCSLFAGRRCPRLFRHGHDNVFLDLREYSSLCSCSCSKVPIAPMGDLSFAPCLQGGGIFVNSGTVTITASSISGNAASYVRDQVQKFLSPPCETHVLLVLCRAEVSMSRVAQ